MGAFEVICGILMVVASLVMIVTVLLQDSESNGMGAITGGAETFFGKNKSNIGWSLPCWFWRVFRRTKRISSKLKYWRYGNCFRSVCC